MSRPLTVVIPAYGDLSRLAALLRELDAQGTASAPLPVLVVDDGSPEPLADGLVEHTFRALDLRVLRVDVNRGPGATRNIGLAEVSTPWVAFLDSDELPGAGWQERIVERVSETDPPDVIEGRIVVGSQRATPFTHIAQSEGWQHVAGNVVYRVESLRAAGAFSEGYYDPKRKLHFREDTELYFRLEERGVRLEYDEHLVALHPPRPRSLLVPLRDARRYFFDPLLSRDHPERFHEFVKSQRVGPVPLRWARHTSAVLFALALLVVIGGAAAGTTWLVVGGSALLAGAWIASVVALAWRRRVVPSDVLPLLAVASLVPMVYLWHYYGGVLRFRHRPRLR